MRGPLAVHPHPFSKAYWIDAATEFANLKSLCYAALLCALAIVLDLFQIPLSETLYISVAFIAVSLCSMVTGPLVAIPCGIIVDVVAFVIRPTGAFFPGYTLTAILSAVVYALFFYRARLSFGRVLAAKGIVNFFINTLLGSVWRSVLVGKSPFLYYILSAGIKNLLLLPLEVCVLCWVFQLLQKPLLQFRVIPEGSDLRLHKSQLIALGVLTLLGGGMLVAFIFLYPQISAFLKGVLS